MEEQLHCRGLRSVISLNDLPIYLRPAIVDKNAASKMIAKQFSPLVDVKIARKHICQKPLTIKHGNFKSPICRGFST
jgi:hypothetical protein